MNATVRSAVLTTLVMTAYGCEFGIVDVPNERVALIAEASILVEGSVDSPTTIGQVFLHGTLGVGGSDLFLPTPEATVTVSTSRGSVALPEVSVTECFADRGPGLNNPGRCYRALLDGVVNLGDSVSLSIVAPSTDQRLTGTTRVPGGFLVHHPVTNLGTCRVPADQTLRAVWSESQGAAAYFTDLVVHGLREVLGQQGVDLGPLEDPTVLEGLAVSSDDTTILVPNEYGDRFDESFVAVLRELQDGLPAATWASVTVGAVDDNLARWHRQAGFNPSGSIRVPSLHGDGTGVFGAAVLRQFTVEVGTAEPGRAACTIAP